MKKILALLAVLALGTFAFADDSMIFKVEGPEKSYNQIRIENETSQADFDCRLVTLELEKDGTYKNTGVYGTYNLKESGDGDSNSGSVERKSYIGIEMPKDFPENVTFEIEYKDYPFYDVIIIHLKDTESEFKEL